MNDWSKAMKKPLMQSLGNTGFQIFRMDEDAQNQRLAKPLVFARGDLL